MINLINNPIFIAMVKSGKNVSEIHEDLIKLKIFKDDGTPYLKSTLHVYMNLVKNNEINTETPILEVAPQVIKTGLLTNFLKKYDRELTTLIILTAVIILTIYHTDISDMLFHHQPVLTPIEKTVITPQEVKEIKEQIIEQVKEGATPKNTITADIKDTVKIASYVYVTHMLYNMVNSVASAGYTALATTLDTVNNTATSIYNATIYTTQAAVNGYTYLHTGVTNTLYYIDTHKWHIAGLIICGGSLYIFRDLITNSLTNLFNNISKNAFENIRKQLQENADNYRDTTETLRDATEALKIDLTTHTQITQQMLQEHQTLINQNTTHLQTILETLKTLQQAKTDSLLSPAASFNIQATNTISTQSLESLTSSVYLDAILTPHTLNESMTVLAQSSNTEIQAVAQEALTNMPLITEILTSQTMQALTTDAIHTGVGLIGAAVLATTAAATTAAAAAAAPATEAATSIISTGLSETLTAASSTIATEIASTTFQQIPEIAMAMIQSIRAQLTLRQFIQIFLIR